MTDKTRVPSLVILDRDGVINEDSDAYIKNADEWQPIPGSLQAIAKLNQAGIKVAVATNQSGLARGLISPENFQAMNEKFKCLLEAEGGYIDHMAYCPHHPDEGCDCRKPAPGLIRQIESALDCSAEGQVFIGDSYKDLEVARAVGCSAILVLTGKGQRTHAKHSDQLDDVVVQQDLQRAVATLLNVANT